jgi:hypothetical protein
MAATCGTSLRKVKEVYDYRDRERQAARFLDSYRAHGAPEVSPEAPVEVNSEREQAPSPPLSRLPSPPRSAGDAAWAGELDMAAFAPLIPGPAAAACGDVFARPQAAPPVPRDARPAGIAEILRASAERRAAAKLEKLAGKRRRRPGLSVVDGDGGEDCSALVLHGSSPLSPGRPVSARVQRFLSKERLEEALDGGGKILRAAYEFAYGVPTASGNLEWIRKRLVEALERE